MSKLNHISHQCVLCAARKQAPYLCVIVTAVLLAFVWGPAGRGHNDTATYFSGARHLAAGDGFVSDRTALLSDSFSPITAFAPGFSTLLVPGVLLGLTPIESARWVLGFSYVVFVLCIFSLARRILSNHSYWISYLVTALFACQPSVLQSMDSALSDLPFAATTLVAVLLAIRVCNESDPKFGLRLGLGVMLGGMQLLRHAGLLMIPGFVSGSFLALKGRPLRDRLRILLPSLAMYLAMTIPWMVRNWVVKRTVFGGRKFLSDFDIATQAAHAASGAFRVLIEVFEGAPKSFIVFYIVVLTAAGITLLVNLLNRRIHGSLRHLLILSPIVLSYTILITLIATIIHFDPIDTPRFWIPIWPLLTLALISLLPTANRPGSVSKPRTEILRQSLVWPYRLALLIAVSVFAVRMARQIPTAQTQKGLLSPEWRKAAALLPDPGRCRLLTTDARPFLLHRALGPTSNIPSSLNEMRAAQRVHKSLCLAILYRDNCTRSRRMREDAEKILKLLAPRPTLLNRSKIVKVYALESGD